MSKKLVGESPALGRIRSAFSNILAQLDGALNDELLGAYPDFYEEAKRVADECAATLKEACDHSPTDTRRLDNLENFAHRLGELRSIVESPTPGELFHVSPHTMKAAFQAIERNLMIGYEVALPGDKDGPEFFLS